MSNEDRKSLQILDLPDLHNQLQNMCKKLFKADSFDRLNYEWQILNANYMVRQVNGKASFK